MVYFSQYCPVKPEAHLQCLWTQWGHGLCVTFELQLCEYYDCCLVQKYVISVTPFQLLKLLSYCIYQKSMSVCCKLYFHSLHIKKSFGNQNLALSCLRAYRLVVFYKHSMYECLCIRFQRWWSLTVKLLMSAIGQENEKGMDEACCLSLAITSTAADACQRPQNVNYQRVPVAVVECNWFFNHFNFHSNAILFKILHFLIHSSC